MTLTVTHKFVSPVPDDNDPSTVSPSNWNDTHTISGTVAASEVTSPGALTKTDDTNVTLTLGGSPSVALLASASLTLGWTGTLAAGRLSSNVVQGVTSDTNVTGAISAQNLTLGWTGTLALSRLAQGTNGQIVVGQTSASPLYKTVSGDATLAASGALTVSKVNSVSYPAGPYVIGDLLYANTTTSMAQLADVTAGNVLLSGGVSAAPAYSSAIQYIATGGASGNGSVNINSAGGTTITSNDLTTLGNSVQLGGAVRAGDTITLTLNYNNASGTARSVPISYGPVTGGDTLTTIAAGLATALGAPNTPATLVNDFAPFRFFVPGTVGNVGSLFKFNFAWLTGGNGTPTLNVVNSSTAGTPTTISMNGTTLAVGAGVTNAILTFDQVPQIAATRNYGTTRAGLANDNLFTWIMASNTSTAATQAQYANISFAIGDPTPATPYGVIQISTGNAWSGQANVWIGKGVFISNFGNSLTPTYPGAVANNRTVAADPGTGSLAMQGWTIPGNAIIGTWPANTAYAMFGNSNLTHTDATKYALIQDTSAGTIVNGSSLGFRINNVDKWDIGTAGGGLYSGGVPGGDKGAGTLNLGGPIYIGGTQIAASNLSDYAQGTWTPTIVGSGTAGTPTYSTQVGSYEKVGRLISVRFSIVISALGGATGNILIGGLPFTAANTANNYGGCSINSYAVSGLAAGAAGLVGFITPNTTQITINQNTNTGATALTVTQAGASLSIFGWALYNT